MMWTWKKKQLESKEYAELKADLQTLKICVASLEASFSNLTNQVLKKIRKNRQSLEVEEEEKEKDIYSGVLCKE